jgi:hypothetical protein
MKTFSASSKQKNGYDRIDPWQEVEAIRIQCLVNKNTAIPIMMEGKVLEEKEDDEEGDDKEEEDQ